MIMIMATSLRENKSLFSPSLADGDRRKGFVAWSPASGGGCPGGVPFSLGPLARGQLPADEHAVCIVLGNQAVL